MVSIVGVDGFVAEVGALEFLVGNSLDFLFVVVISDFGEKWFSVREGSSWYFDKEIVFL